MWTYLANWLVQDGEIPELHTGATLRNVALRAASWSLQDSQEPEGVSQHHGPGPDSPTDTRYDLTGTVEAAREPGSVLLRVGSFRVLAEPDSVREVGGGGLERYSPNFPIPAVGTRATVGCTLEVMAWYETEDDFVGLPTAGLARDWHVERIRLAHRAWIPTPGQNYRSVGPLLRVEGITRMHRWADEPGDEHVAYLLDLHAT